MGWYGRARRTSGLDAALLTAASRQWVVRCSTQKAANGTDALVVLAAPGNGGDKHNLSLVAERHPFQITYPARAKGYARQLCFRFLSLRLSILLQDYRQWIRLEG